MMMGFYKPDIGPLGFLSVDFTSDYFWEEVEVAATGERERWEEDMEEMDRAQHTRG